MRAISCARCSCVRGMQTGCPEEIAFARGWVDAEALTGMAAQLSKNDYGRYLQGLLTDRMMEG